MAPFITLYIVIANIAIIIKCYKVFLSKMLVKNAFLTLGLILVGLISMDMYFYAQITEGYGYAWFGILTDI
ncbi:hypothetical protein [Flammeovirga aprica]|uniref:Uncharacterized protein n=1 Tax=Flammeovirga aprica JL-4 TaxID=694437 RepID=A0A7X9S045_9BACT|nr:hypothetical protein [Flammeovirga aprica]NME71797.1 hypothetical protein [Flammeovirga aprica JL-4]